MRSRKFINFFLGGDLARGGTRAGTLEYIVGGLSSVSSSLSSSLRCRIIKILHRYTLAKYPNQNWAIRTRQPFRPYIDSVVDLSVHAI